MYINLCARKICTYDYGTNGGVLGLLILTCRAIARRSIGMKFSSNTGIELKLEARTMPLTSDTDRVESFTISYLSNVE
jgi:hypothetical protein